MSNTTHDVIIIGSGPAGYSAAVYAARAGLMPLLFEGDIAAGGALMNTTEVENFPGFPDGVLGPDLMEKMRTQAEKFGTEFVTASIVQAKLEQEVKKVTDSAANDYYSRSVILATGSRYRTIGLAAEERLSGRGVSWCATCDGFFFKGQDIAVVGGGDSALEEATFLTRFARSVTIIHRRDKLRASKFMQERARRDQKINFLWNREVTDILGSEKVSGVRVRDVTSDSEEELAVTGLFIAIGHDPEVDVFRGQVSLDHAGYVAVDGRTTLTNLDGVFACGDVVDHEYRQAITAAGSGCAAALDAERFLAALDDCASPEEARMEASALAELAH
ncbi:thioredoxin-disulfide reductase [Streptomyces sp. NPDC005385]|uniref:thioredoxin-disulfide reductase n=1 Tax=Streptomyces sp. NPDC005385 TaxID=3157039 RepID=UPI0033A6A7AD